MAPYCRLSAAGFFSFLFFCGPLACDGGSVTDSNDADSCGGVACELGWACMAEECLELCNRTDDCSQIARVCKSGVCVVSAGECAVNDDCDDANVCTQDTCDASQECAHQYPEEPTTCALAGGDDGWCKDGECVHCTQPEHCADDNPCTATSCSAAGTCEVELLSGDECDDGDACTQTDACNEGVCEGSDPVACVSPPPNECLESDTQFLSYSSVGNCDPADGSCHYDSQQSDCPSCLENCLEVCAGVACTESNGGCQSNGLCVPGLPPTCQYDQADDGAPCDLFAGDAVSDDGVCSDGQCVECTQNIHCDDGKGCTADVCDLTTWTCSNTLMGIGTLCRPAAPGSCDVAEHCNGTSEECPADGFQTSGFPCRGSLTECDKAELCSGDSPDCPEDVLQPDTHQCRPAAPGGCDAPEFCTGADPDCPEDVFLPDTHQCRPPASFDCDVAEFCTGDSAVCPDDIIVQPTTECGARSCSGLDWVMQMCGLSGTCSLSGPAEHCDDANACTTDACDASTGCSHSAPCAAGGYCYEQSVCMARYAHLECTDGDMQARLTAFSDEGGTIYHLKVDLDNDWDGCTSGWQESTTAAIDCGWSDTSVTGSLDGSGASLDAATLNCYPYPASSPCACTASGPWQL